MSSRFSSLSKFKIFGIAEILFILLAGNLIIRFILGGWLTPDFFGIGDAGVDSLAIGLYEGFTIALRFGFMIVVGFFLIQKLYGIKPKNMGLTLNHIPIFTHIKNGAFLFAIAFLPWFLLLFINDLFALSGDILDWKTRSFSSFASPAFVAITLATGMLIPPLFEEVFVRGYARSRLTMDFGPLGAAVVSSIIFTLSHGHFYGLEFALIGTQLLIIYGFSVVAYFTYKCGSLLPAIIAHALLNLPIPYTTSVVGVILGFILIIIYLSKKDTKGFINAVVGEWQHSSKGLLVFGSLGTVVLMLVLILPVILFRTQVAIYGVLSVALILTLINFARKKA